MKINKTKALSKGRIALIVVIAVTTLLIWAQSLLPQHSSAAESTAVRNFLNTLLGGRLIGTFFYDYIRKFAHFTEYAVLGLEWSFNCKLKRKYNKLLVFIGLASGLLTAAVDESLQLLSDRGAAVMDVLLDYSGYIGGFLVVAVITVLVRRCRKDNKIHVYGTHQ